MKLADDNIAPLIKNVLARTTEILQKNFKSARLDAEILLAHVLKVSRTYLYTNSNQKISSNKIKILTKLLQKRLNGEPIAYIIGKKEFWSLELRVNKNVLVPRPETELLVETILEIYGKEKNLSLLDLGTGSGAIALALAHEKTIWQITATDICPKALAVARKNAKILQIKNIKFINSDLFNRLEQKKFNIIVSNPPYIDKNDPMLENFVSMHEPHAALFATDNGLAIIKNIILSAQNYLHENGKIFLEHGYAQADYVRKLFYANNYKNITSKKDLLGYERITYASK